MNPSAPAIEAYLLTDPGRKRAHNEDHVGYFVPEDPEELAANGQLYVLADGVGGASAGDVASEYAVRKVLHAFFDASEPDLEQRLVGAVRAANADIYEYAISSNKPNMATTLVVAQVRGSAFKVANVGDSRAYLIRDDTIRQITRDHSLVDQLVEGGSLSPEEAREHPRKNVILRSLGSESQVAVDVFAGTLRGGDSILLCSDGLTRYLDDDEIRRMVSHLDGEDACRRLIKTANDRGGEDNISVVLLKYQALPAPVLGETLTARTSSAVDLTARSRPTDPGGIEMDKRPRMSSPYDYEGLSGRPRTLQPLPEPPTMRERLAKLPWRDIGYGAGALVVGVGLIVVVGFLLPRIGSQREQAATEEAAFPTVTLEPTADVVSPGDLGEFVNATALPASEITLTPSPSPQPTQDPLLAGPVEIFEGEFLYGSSPLQSEAALTLCAELGGTCLPEYFSDSEPAVRIYLDHYFIDRVEVTNLDYRACVDDGGCEEPAGLGAENLNLSSYYFNESNSYYPVVGVTWEQAQTYCEWAGGALPTEAQWEKAAAWNEITNEKYMWPWGNEWNPDNLNFRQPEQIGSGASEAVGTRPLNVSPYGVLDMAGNVAEWTADWYAADYYETLTQGQTNPQGPAQQGADPYRVMRGGSWADNGVFTRTVQRVLALEDHFNSSIGFRCAYDRDPRPSPGPGAGASGDGPLVPGGNNNSSTSTPAATSAP